MTSFLLGVDFSWTMPDPATVEAAAYGFMIGYISDDATKDLTPARVAAIQAAGLGVGFIFETIAQRALDGQAAGTEDGTNTLARLRAIGAPPGVPVFVNVGDFAAPAAQLPAIQGYYYGWRHALAEYMPGAGGYATGYIIDQLVAGGALGTWWQNAMDDAGQPGTVLSAHASLYQRVKPVGTVDGQPVADPSKLPADSFDEDVAGFGPVPSPAWWMAAPPAPPPPPVPVLMSVELVSVYSDGTAKTIATVAV